MRVVLGLGLLLIPSWAVAQDAAPLELTCGGGGSATKQRGTSAFASGSDGDTAWVQGSRAVDVGFQDQVGVRLFNGDDRIRLPRTMLPPIRGGDGWFKLKNVVVSERVITASAAINAMNNPKVHVDRITGTISISGKAGSYTERCQKIDASAKPQF